MMRWFQFAPPAVTEGVPGSSPAPTLARSVVRGALGFAVVSMAGFAPWALAGRALQSAVGELGLYIVCAAVFMGLGGLFLHRLLIRPGSLLRFYGLFTTAFGAYAICWTVAWMTLRGHTGSAVGLLLGTSAMAWVFVRAFDAAGVFVRISAALFLLNAIGYFGGGWAESAIARNAISLPGLSLDRPARLSFAMLTWGFCYGITFGAGLGLAFYWCQTAGQKSWRESCHQAQ